MLDEDLQFWENSADAWIKTLNTRGDQSRIFLDPRVHRTLGDVANQKGLDIGCGEGPFLRQLAERGAIVSAVEPTPKLFQAACEQSPNFEILQAKAEQLPFANETFDLAIFYLVLIDIEPFEPAVEEAFRVLKPGGRCVIINSTSMNTASKRLWEVSETGERTAWYVEHYGVRQQIVAEWGGIRINNYHRPLSTYFTHCLRTGFQLKSFEEQIPTEDEIAANPKLKIHLICPYFNIQVWQKPMPIV